MRTEIIVVLRVLFSITTIPTIKQDDATTLDDDDDDDDDDATTLVLPAGEVLLAHAERHTVLATGDAPALLCVLDNRHHGGDYDLP